MICENERKPNNTVTFCHNNNRHKIIIFVHFFSHRMQNMCENRTLYGILSSLIICPVFFCTKPPFLLFIQWTYAQWIHISELLWKLSCFSGDPRKGKKTFKWFYAFFPEIPSMHKRDVMKRFINYHLNFDIINFNVPALKTPTVPIFTNLLNFEVSPRHCGLRKVKKVSFDIQENIFSKNNERWIQHFN